MRRTVILGVACIAALLILPTAPASACSCVANPDPAETFEGADAIAIGDVVNVDTRAVDGGDVQIATVRVVFDLKDALPGEIDVEQDLRSSCSAALAVDDRFSAVVYPAEEGQAWVTDLCSQVSESAMLKVAGIDSPPPTPAPGPSPTLPPSSGEGATPWLVFGSLMLAGIGIGLWIVMRSRRGR